MAGTSGPNLATAYVKILPSMQGAEGKIKEALGHEVEGAGDSGESLAAKIKGFIIKAGIGAAIGKTIKEGVDQGAALQQSVGGIETLFQESADQMKEYAKNAYDTAGLSANEYMEQASSFAASLVASTGKNTADAAKIADLAMRDMSDNANKMGTDMESIQNAYQGFAKQNYTMLDNLKLGYGGTKEEMQRLLTEAEKISGIHYDISNLGDVYNAIHVIQDDLKITGTTANEAATTFSGSFGAMKAAAQNLFAYMALEGTKEGKGFDVVPAMTHLVETASTFLFDNALPMIGRFLRAIPEAFGSAFQTAIPKIREKVPPMIRSIISYFRENIPKFIELGKSAIVEFGKGMAEQFPQLGGIFNNLLPILKSITVAFGAVRMVNVFKSVQSSISGLMAPLAGVREAMAGVSGFGPKLAAGFTAIGGPAIVAMGAVAALGAAFMTLWQTNENFRNAIVGIWEQIKGTFDELCQGIVDRINALGFDFEDITEVLSEAWSGFCDFLAPIFEGAFQIIADTFQAATDVLFAIWDTFSALFSGDWEGFWSGIQTVVDTCWQFIGQLISTTVEAITSAISVFLSWFGIEWSADLTTIQTVWNTVWSGIQQFIDATISTIQGIVGAFIALFNGDWDGFCSGLSSTWGSLWSGIQNFASEIWNGIKGTASDLFGQIKQTICDKWEEMKTSIHEVWDNLVKWLTGKWTDLKETAGRLVQKVADAIVAPFTWAKERVEDVWNWITGHKEVDVKVNTEYTESRGKPVNVTKNARGGIFGTATFFPASNNIVGEAGPEAVLPLNEFYQHLDSSIRSGYQAAPDPRIDTMVKLLAVIADKGSDLYLDKKALVGGLVDEMEKQMEMRSKVRRKVVGLT